MVYMEIPDILYSSRSILEFRIRDLRVKCIYRNMNMGARATIVIFSLLPLGLEWEIFLMIPSLSIKMARTSRNRKMWFMTMAPKESKIAPSAYSEGEKNVALWKVILDMVKATALSVRSEQMVMISDLLFLVLKWYEKRANPAKSRDSHLIIVYGELYDMDEVWITENRGSPSLLEITFESSILTGTTVYWWSSPSFSFTVF